VHSDDWEDIMAEVAAGNAMRLSLFDPALARRDWRRAADELIARKQEY
jgi:hypothetical protein